MEKIIENFNLLVGFCENYFFRLGYNEKSSSGLLQPAYPDAFNPCAGHAEITKLANSSALEKPVKWITIEPVYRHLDMQDRNHLSLFEMLTYVNAIYKQKASKEEIINQQLGLYRALGIDMKRLHITTFAGGRLLGKEMPADKESERIWAKLLGKDKVHPLKSTANIEFWQKEGEQAGPRCEIFLKKGREFLEIGTVVFDDHVFHNGRFVSVPNSIYGGAGGIERLEMAINDYQSIWETGSIKPIIELVKSYSNVGNLAFLQDELLRTSDNLKSALLLVTEGQEKNNKTRRGQRLTALVNETKRGLDKLNVFDYQNLCSDLAVIIQEIYGERYEFYKKINFEILASYLSH